MTPEQLREEAVAIERMHGETLTVEWRIHMAELLRAHAAALEEIERLKERNAALEAHIEPSWLKLISDAQSGRVKAEAERDALKRHAEEVKRDLAASVVKSAELEEENSKLRSALAIVHFKREPWQ